MFLIGVLDLSVTPRTYAPPLPSTLSCLFAPNLYHHHYEVNHQNGLKTKEIESPTRLQGFIPNGAFIGALRLNMNGNSHRYTDWCPVMMRCFAINQETLDWSRFRSVILHVVCLDTHRILVSEQNDLTAVMWSQRVMQPTWPQSRKIIKSFFL